jgi:hypothetical protein
VRGGTRELNEDRHQLTETYEEHDPYEQLDEAWFELGDDETDALVRAHLAEFCIRSPER